MQRARVRELFGDALRLKLALAVSIAAVLIAAAGPISSIYGNADLVLPLRAIALVVLGQSVMMLAGGTFNALRRVSQNLVMVLGDSVNETIASVVMVVVGLGASGATRDVVT
jgi:O-antigen/teichoic acid export membrane protein